MKINRLRYLFLFLVLGSYWSVKAQLGSQKLASDDPIFSHQYTFIDDDQYYFIDTTFNSLHWYHQFNHSGKDRFGYSRLGNMGAPLTPLTYPDAEDFWNYYTLGAYSKYYRKQEEIPFYYVRSPLTEANYWMGYDRGQSFNIYHTQNINENWNFLIGYRRLNDLGFYNHNRNIQSTFTANTSYAYEPLGYSLKAYFLNEKSLLEENGGIIDDSLFEDNLISDRILLNVRLENDNRILRSREFYLDQSVTLNRLFHKKEPKDSLKETGSANAILLGYTFKYSRKTNAYNGFTSSDAYENYFYEHNGDYKDSSGYKSYANTFYLKGEVGKKNKLDVKAGLRNLATQYGSYNYSFNTSNWGVVSDLNGRVWDRINIKASLDYILTGNLKESVNFEGSAGLRFFDWLRAFGGYHYSLRYPEFFDQFYISNNYIWQNDFQKISEGKLQYGIGWGKDNMLELSNYTVTNLVYYDEKAQPAQSDKVVKVFRAKLVQNFSFWHLLHQDNQVYYQKVTGNADAMPLPAVVTRNSLYFEFYLFKRALKCLAGGEVKYFTSYYSPSYNPATGRLYNAMEKKVGDYPLVDVFANFELKHARIFLKYEHVNEGLDGYSYFAAPHYPFPDRVLRVGITWRFFN